MCARSHWTPTRDQSNDIGLPARINGPTRAIRHPVVGLEDPPVGQHRQGVLRSAGKPREAAAAEQRTARHLALCEGAAAPPVQAIAAHSRPTPRRTRRYDTSCCWTFEQADCRRHACISPSASAMPKAAALRPFRGSDRCQPVHESGRVPTRHQETLMRFSTVAGERGTPDTYRDPRGLALKFYTS